MPALFPLSEERYAKKLWQKTRNWSFLTQRPLLPIIIQELPSACAAMPLAFVKQEPDRFHLVAVLGTALDQSLAVGPMGQWRPDHYPVLFSTYPFVLVDDKKGNQMVAVDESTGLVGNETGMPFFEETGEPIREVKEIVAQLKQVAVSRLATQKAVDALATADLFEQLEMTVNNTRLKGLYYLNEKKLRDLPADQLKILLDNGALTIGYAHLFSLSRFSLIEKWARNGSAPTELKDLDLKSLFDDKDDMIRF
jgi:hypothetical protein